MKGDQHISFVLSTTFHSKFCSIVISENDSEVCEGSPWYFFNDFLVKNVQEGEVSQFPSAWKVCG